MYKESTCSFLAVMKPYDIRYLLIAPNKFQVIEDEASYKRKEAFKKISITIETELFNTEIIKKSSKYWKN